VKTQAFDRVELPSVPAYIRAVGTPLKTSDKDYLRRKLGRKLGKFVPAVERASVRMEDVNGPKGGIDKQCRIKVVLKGLPSVLVEERSHSVQAAMDLALTRAEYAVRQAMKRRSMRPLKQRATVRRSAARL
jgi:ribosome-associated translation inhibitor RaiA